MGFPMIIAGPASLEPAGSHPQLGATGTVVGSCRMLFLSFLLLHDGRQMFGSTVRSVPIEPQRRGEPFVDETLARQP